MKTLIKFLIINAFILMVYIFSGCEQITDPVDNSATDNNTLNKAYQTRPFVAEVVATFLTQVLLLSISEQGTQPIGVALL